MRSFRVTTALTMSLALLPGAPPAFAQQGRAAEAEAQALAKAVGLEQCDKGGAAPCVTADGALLVRAEVEGLDQCVEGGDWPCLTEEGLVKVDPSSPLAAAALQAAPTDAAQPGANGKAKGKERAAEAKAQSEAPEPKVVEAEEDTGEGGAASDVAAGEAPVADEATTEAEQTEPPGQAPDDGQAAEAPPERDADAIPAEEVAKEAAPAEDVAEQPTEAKPVEDVANDATDAATAEDVADDAADVAPTEDVAEQPSEAKPNEDVAEQPTEAAPVEDVADDATGAAPTEQVAGDATEAAPAEETVAEAAPDEEQIIEEEPQLAEDGTVILDDAPEAEAAAAAGDDMAESDAATDVETVEVTEETARSATEEFTTKATGNVAANAEASSGGGGGLSDFERAVLLGLGAVAVGSILDNGSKVVSNSGDRLVVEDQRGNLRVLKDDDVLLRRPGSEVRTETFDDGSTRSIVTRPDGTRIVTIRAADGRVVRRSRILEDGTRVVLFDDTDTVAPVKLDELPEARPATIDIDTRDEAALRRALMEAEARDVDRRFSLRQIRQIEAVRELAPQIEIDAVTFPTGSAAIQASQAEELSALGRTMARMIDENPAEVFLIEGHTDAVGNATYNLALSDRRAETLALALAEYYDVPPENMITQGYGESQLKVPTLGPERENRRATVRRITPLLTASR